MPSGISAGFSILTELTNEREIRRKLSWWRILLPIAFGLLAASYLLYNALTEVQYREAKNTCGTHIWEDGNGNGEIDTDKSDDFLAVPDCSGTHYRMTYSDVLGEVQWNWNSTFWMFMALLAMVMRDAAYMYRIRELTDRFLTWRQSFDVIMLWEFASALTPSVVGGSGVALFILNREKIKLGRSTALVMVTALMDELFYISLVPLTFLLVGGGDLFPVAMERTFFGITFGTRALFWVGYAFIVAMTLAILGGVIFRPRYFKYLLVRIFKLPFLRHLRYRAAQLGDDLIITSAELKGKTAKYWIRPIVATYFSWFARYLVVNFIILAFASTSEHVLIFARQLVMWVIMLISPTPGSSGVAELAFDGFLGEFIPLGLAGTLAIIWRLISYYPYLFIGAIILPRWLRRTSPRANSAKK